MAKQKMSPEVIAKLDAARRVKREREPLLRDVTPDQIRVACDAVKDKGLGFRDPATVAHCRVTRLSPEQEAALVECLPTIRRKYERPWWDREQVFSGMQLVECCCWERDAIRAVLTFLNVQDFDRKYIRWWHPGQAAGVVQ